MRQELEREHLMRKKAQQFGPWAIVTGANSGIGAAFAQRLATQGYNLVLVGRRSGAVEDAAQKIEQTYGVKTQCVIADLSTDGFLEKISEATKDLDIGLLISNAGDDAMGAMLRVELDRLKQMLRLNTQSHLELAHYFGRRFEARGKGGILLVSSTAGLQATPFMANYAGAKSYLLNLGMALNYEMQKTGVNVTVLLPGPTKTPGLVDKPDIPLNTLPAPQMKADTVAKIGTKALAKNKPYVIAGTVNRLMARVGALLGKTGGRNMWGSLVKSIVPKDLSIS